MTEIERDSTRYLIGFLIAAIFSAEGLIIVALPSLGITNVLTEVFIHAGLLSAMLFPLLYFGVIQEIKSKSSRIEAMERNLRNVNAALESRVTERTEELMKSKRHLEEVLHDLEGKQKKLGAVRGMHRLLHSARDEAEIYRIAQTELEKILPQATGALYITKASRNILLRVAQWPADALSWEDSITPDACWALRLGQAYHSRGKDSVCCAHGSDESTRFGTRICVPLIARGETLGALSLEPQEEWTDKKVEEYEDFVVTIAGGLALAIANTQLRETLKTQAYQDQLTGLFNRHFLLKQIELEIHKSERSKQPLTAVMLDIDHFKRFNDVYGHAAGDAVLASFAAILRNTLRAGDVSCRYGGEEFAVLLPGASTETAVMRINEILGKLRQMDIEYKGQKLGAVSVSAGVASFRIHGNNTDELLQAADQALYVSKKNGRDRVTVASLDEKGALQAAISEVEGLTASASKLGQNHELDLIRA